MKRPIHLIHYLSVIGFCVTLFGFALAFNRNQASDALFTYNPLMLLCGLLMVGLILFIFHANVGRYIGIDKRFPRSATDLWYSGQWYTAGEGHYLLPRTGKDFAFYPLFLNGRFFNGLVPAKRIDNVVGLYKVIRGPYYGSYSKGSDPEYWDNGKSVDLQLIKVISLEAYEKEMEEVLTLIRKDKNARIKHLFNPIG